MSDQNYMSVGPMFFTSIDQMIEYLKHLTAKDAIEVLEETKRQGYELSSGKTNQEIADAIKIPLKPKELTPEDFERVPEIHFHGCGGCYFDGKECDGELFNSITQKLGYCCRGYIFRLKSK
jgi:hypothetical protein